MTLRHSRPAAAPMGALLPVFLVLLGACGGPRFEETPAPRPQKYPASASDTSDAGVPERLLARASRTTYRLYVADDSTGVVSRVGFVPGRGATVEATVGRQPADSGVVGPYGLAVAPDGRHWYLSVARPTGVGSVWEHAAGPDTVTARADVGRFPTALDLTPDGAALVVTNSDLRGRSEPSVVTVLRAPGLTGPGDVTTCVLPMGSRLSRSGAHQYSVCQASDQLVELEPSSREVTKRFSVAPGRERSLPLSDTGVPGGPPSPGLDRIEVRPELQRRCAPTWAEPAMGTRADRIVYVACSGEDSVLAVSTVEWDVNRSIPVGRDPLELEATDDGQYLAVTLHGAGAVELLDLDRPEKEAVRLGTSAPGPHGVVASPDSRYLFVTTEGTPSAPGGLDVFDLRTLKRVATVRLGPRPGAVAFWEIARLGR